MSRDDFKISLEGEPMSAVGASWDEDGKARIYAEGYSGSGEITGLSPHHAMYFAVLLARNARSRGVPWPTQFMGDPFEEATVKALQVELGERPADEPPEPMVDVEDVLYHLDELEELLRRARGQLRDARRALHSDAE